MKLELSIWMMRDGQGLQYTGLQIESEREGLRSFDDQA